MMHNGRLCTSSNAPQWGTFEIGMRWYYLHLILRRDFVVFYCLRVGGSRPRSKLILRRWHFKIPKGFFAKSKRALCPRLVWLSLCTWSWTLPILATTTATTHIFQSAKPMPVASAPLLLLVARVISRGLCIQYTLIRKWIPHKLFI